MAALAVLLILVGALGATMLVLQVGDRIEVVKVTKEIPAGQSVDGGNVESVLVVDDPEINYIPWTQLAALKKLKAVSTIPANVVAVGDMFGDSAKIPDGKSVVGLSLKEGQYPAGIDGGDTVAVYRVGGAGSGSGSGGEADEDGGAAAGDSDSLLVEQARVESAPGQGGDSSIVSSTNLPVTLLVDSARAAALTQAASNGEVALVLVPGN